MRGRASLTHLRSSRNARRSPLLRLPLELRNLIYAEIFGGGRILHVDWKWAADKDRWGCDDGSLYWLWSTAFCVAGTHDTTESKQPGGDIPIPTAPGAPEQVEDSCIWHEICDYYTSGDDLSSENSFYEDTLSDNSVEAADEAVSRETIDLRVLETCRQIYQEATLMLWSVPIFSFRDGRSFNAFKPKFSRTERSMIKKLYIRIESLKSYMRWVEALRKPYRCPAFPGLRELHLDIRLPFKSLCLEDKDMKNYEDLSLEEIFQFKAPTLERVTVRFHNVPMSHGADLLPASDRIALAEQLKARLLEPETTIDWHKRIWEDQLKQREEREKWQRKFHRMSRHRKPRKKYKNYSRGDQSPTRRDE